MAKLLNERSGIPIRHFYHFAKKVKKPAKVVNFRGK